MRYENPLYMAEDAGAADLIAGGRLQLGISRGSPEQVIDGWRYFGYRPAEGQTDADMARGHAQVLLDVLRGEGFAEPNPHPMFPNPPGLLRLEPHSPGLRDRIWWGAGSNATAAWAATLGMNLQSSTLSRTMRAASRSTSQQARADRCLPRGVEERRARRASRESRSAAASSRSSTTATAAYFGGGAGDGDQSGTSTRAPARSSGARTPRNRMRSSSSSPRTRRSRPPTRCCSLSRTSSASTTTPTSSRASSSTSPPRSAGVEARRHVPGLRRHPRERA